MQNRKMEDSKVLIVEDNEMNRTILVEMLNVMGITSDSVEDGHEAVEKSKNNPYDLILMDITMPRKDGYQACREIRTLPIEQPIIIALTASVLEGDYKKCKDAGMDDYLRKPIEFSELEETIKRYLANGI